MENHLYAFPEALARAPQYAVHQCRFLYRITDLFTAQASCLVATFSLQCHGYHTTKFCSGEAVQIPNTMLTKFCQYLIVRMTFLYYSRFSLVII